MIGVVGVLFVAGIVLFNFVLMPVLVHNRAAVIVPDLRQISEAQASETLEKLALTLRVTHSENSAEVPEGYVISQSPRPNESIKEGRSVEVVLSLGAKTQRVPDLAGMSLRQVRGMLDRLQLRAGRVSRVLVSGAAREEVVASTPPAGMEVIEGSSVDLVVAVGGQKNNYLMPDLQGQDLLFIKDKLREMGFRVASVRYEKREGVYPNTVVGQSPSAGAMIREGDSIELVAAGSD